MNKKNIIILTIAIIFLIVALGIYLYANSLKNGKKSNSTPKPITSNSKIEEPVFYFFNDNGEKFSLNDFSDKPIAMLFWKSDNSKSYEIINLFEKYYEKYKNEINFLVININEANIDSDIIENVKAANFSIPMYFDTDLTNTNKYNYDSLPYIIFINKNGNIDKETSKNITENMFTANLDLLIENY